MFPSFKVNYPPTAQWTLELDPVDKQFYTFGSFVETALERRRDATVKSNCLWDF
jgi:hypothetical protein